MGRHSCARTACSLFACCACGTHRTCRSQPAAGTCTVCLVRCRSRGWPCLHTHRAGRQTCKRCWRVRRPYRRYEPGDQATPAALGKQQAQHAEPACGGERRALGRVGWAPLASIDLLTDLGHSQHGGPRPSGALLGGRTGWGGGCRGRCTVAARGDGGGSRGQPAACTASGAERWANDWHKRVGRLHMRESKGSYCSSRRTAVSHLRRADASGVVGSHHACNRERTGTAAFRPPPWRLQGFSAGVVHALRAQGCRAASPGAGRGRKQEAQRQGREDGALHDCSARF